MVDYARLYDTLAPLGRFAKLAGLAIGGLVLVAVVTTMLVAVGATFGGLIGAGLAVAYNTLFGMSLPVWKAAFLGSVITVAAGGGSAAGSSDE